MDVDGFMATTKLEQKVTFQQHFFKATYHPVQSIQKLRMQKLSRFKVELRI